MKHFLTTCLAVIVAQVVLLVLFFAGSALLMGILVMGKSGKGAVVPEHAYIIQEIPSAFIEFAPPRHLPFPKKSITHTMILENLEKARFDDRVEGVILKIQPLQVGWGKLQEIRERIHQLREADKQVIAYADFATNKSFYLAAACDSIFMSPGGMMWLSGFMAERFYLKDLVDDLGLDVQVSRIKEYKAAAEILLRKDMSQPARENAEWVLEDLYEDFLTALARDRGVDHEQVLEWMELAQFAPDDAREQGLIDGVLFWEALEERRKGDAEEFASVKGVDYAKVQRAQLGLRGSRIAVVHGEGTITTGKSGWIYPLGVSMGDETMVEALQQVMENDRIKAVLLRLDTPGGLSLASDRIGRMVERVCKKKPVVVSTVDVNASGGYMVSYRCSTLVALPSSIVGSIGSFAMRGNAARMMEKIGVTWDRVTVGPHATTFSPVIPLTGEEFERFEQVHWKGYERWVQGVAHHRGMSREQVDSVARGRVFTGRQALGNGLIDDLGGFDCALALCKQKAGIPEDEDVTLVHYPVRKEIWEELASGEWGAALAHLTRLLGSGTETQERVASTVDFWQQWFESKESLALYWWRF